MTGTPGLPGISRADRRRGRPLGLVDSSLPSTRSQDPERPWDPRDPPHTLPGSRLPARGCLQHLQSKEPLSALLTASQSDTTST